MAPSSNILDILNPPKSRDLTDEELKDCVPCQAMASFCGIVGGLYLNSNHLFKDSVTGEIDIVKNPSWWRKTVKVTGVTMVMFGVYRAGQGWLWDKDREYKDW